eukprot:gene8863-1590_t
MAELQDELPITGEVDAVEDAMQSVENANALIGDSEGQPDPDALSIYIGNVEYETSPEELVNIFQKCGDVARCTILCDKYAYLEFVTQDAVEAAVALGATNLEHRGRSLKSRVEAQSCVVVLAPSQLVCAKRKNIPGESSRGRGRGGRFRGGPRRRYDDGYGGYGRPRYFCTLPLLDDAPCQPLVPCISANRNLRGAASLAPERVPVLYGPVLPNSSCRTL